jgi:hypothetical protein
MFSPSKEQVREFFAGAWRKHLLGQPLTPIETQAAHWMAQHPEYHADLESPDAVDADYAVEAGRTNPFLHLSMHLAITEQLSIDQPPGIRAAHERLLRRHGNPHDAAHEIMECLGQVVWEAQRLGKPFSSEQYLELLNRKAAGV